jgi:hypothetical protein
MVLCGSAFAESKFRKCIHDRGLSFLKRAFVGIAATNQTRDDPLDSSRPVKWGFRCNLSTLVVRYFFPGMTSSFGFGFSSNASLSTAVKRSCRSATQAA